ncbi:MAG: hypothetical protein M3069_09950, partial [Chloroflexota bacterium]|nr:hypothetical protein [Chloroflexota bacterium]
PGTQLGDPIWRGDLFRLTEGPRGNWDRAHYHPRFQGTSAGERHLDPELSRDPISWALGAARRPVQPGRPRRRA